jgi:hypothetical protein
MLARPAAILARFGYDAGLGGKSGALCLSL